ncbi:hypothetical protein [Flavobacterium piscinae]|nr:hypothetical protein [Flavobacterium piscinae]
MASYIYLCKYRLNWCGWIDGKLNLLLTTIGMSNGDGMVSNRNIVKCF